MLGMKALSGGRARLGGDPPDDATDLVGPADHAVVDPLDVGGGKQAAREPPALLAGGKPATAHVLRVQEPQPVAALSSVLGRVVLGPRSPPGGDRLMGLVFGLKSHPLPDLVLAHLGIARAYHRTYRAAVVRCTHAEEGVEHRIGCDHRIGALEPVPPRGAATGNDERINEIRSA